MRISSRAFAALAALAVLAAVVVGGCGGSTAQPAPSATAPPSVPAGISGTIHKLTRDADTGQTVILVVDDGAMPGAVDRAVVKVTSDTVVWMLKGETGTAADLGPGQFVSVWFDGPVAESYPVQATAADIRILLDD